jgi:lipopolysaccharide biosynthesis glycosyltransferase
MLESLREHLSPRWTAHLHLLHAGLPPASLNLIAARIDCHPIELTAAQLASAPRAANFPPEASTPLLLGDLLPASLDRVLFLDADTLVLDDLSELWRLPLDSQVLGATQDAALPLVSSPRAVKNWQALGIPPSTPYFNAGVLLIDLERWRRLDVCRLVRGYFDSTRETIDFLHQEALNAVLWNRWLHLDVRWNLLASHAGRSYGRIPAEALRHPGIVHFAGRMKPWRAPVGGPFNAAYQQVVARLRPELPPDPVLLQDLLGSLYDRYFRSALFPLEQFLWRRRLI